MDHYHLLSSSSARYRVVAVTPPASSPRSTTQRQSRRRNLLNTQAQTFSLCGCGGNYFEARRSFLQVFKRSAFNSTRFREDSPGKSCSILAEWQFEESASFSPCWHIFLGEPASAAFQAEALKQFPVLTLRGYGFSALRRRTQQEQLMHLCFLWSIRGF